MQYISGYLIYQNIFFYITYQVTLYTFSNRISSINFREGGCVFQYNLGNLGNWLIWENEQHKGGKALRKKAGFEVRQNDKFEKRG